MLATLNTRPMSVWRGFHDDMERWLSAAEQHAEASGAWVPLVDVVEEQDHYIFRADLPGVELGHIEVLFDEGMLTIRGERKDTKDVTENTENEHTAYHRIERSYGSFKRSYQLPDAVDVENITAKSDNGVLEVRVPKQEKTQRKIEIQS